jgi:PTS system nitrogen regulatory IIA component
MKFSSLLNDDLILFAEDIENYNDAIRLLADKIYEHCDHTLDKEAMISAIYNREELGSTVFDHGIAIPHARIENFKDLIVAVIVFKKALKKENTKVNLLFMVVTSASSSQLYLNTLAAIAQISQNRQLYEELQNCESSSAFIDILADADIKIKKELTVADIMTKEVISVAPDFTLKTVMDLFAKHSLSYAPVLDQNRLVGEITISDIVALGIPEYASMVGNLSFLSSFEPFESLLAKEKTILVGNVMQEPKVKLTPDASIIEMAFELIRSHKRHAAVVKDDTFTGVVSLVDLMNKVIRA